MTLKNQNNQKKPEKTRKLEGPEKAFFRKKIILKKYSKIIILTTRKQ